MDRSALAVVLLTLAGGACSRNEPPTPGATSTVSGAGSGATTPAAEFQSAEHRCDDGEAAACYELGRMLSQGASRNLEQAAESYRRGCDGGLMKACTALGDAYAERRGVKRDGAKARAYYQRACTGNELLGCARLGRALSKGRLGARHDLKRALKLYRHACDGGEQEGCLYLSDPYLYGYGVVENIGRGTSLMRQACEKGCARACNNVGHRLEHGDGILPSNVFAALPAYRQGCALGDGGCCTNLAFLYLRGFGVERDIATAHEYDRRACELGNAWACSNMGHSFFMGHGAEKDLVKAVRYSSEACRDLVPRACSNLGVMNKGMEQSQAITALIKTEVDATASYLERLCLNDEREACGLSTRIRNPRRPDDRRADLQQDEQACLRGDGKKCNAAGWAYEHGSFYVLPNAKLAAEFYRKSCDLDYAKGCTNWGFALVRGFGVSVDYEKSFTASEKACEGGNKEGCNNVAWAYTKGLGVPIDLDSAVTLYDRACQQKDSWACANLGNLQLRRAKPRPAAARQAYELGCKLDNATTCRRLAQMLLDGIGGGRDEARARMLLHSACAGGHAPACGLVNELGARN